MNIKNIKIGNGWKTLGATVGTGLIGEAIGKRLVKMTGVPKGGKLGVVVGIGAGIVAGAATTYSSWSFDDVFGVASDEPLLEVENGD